MYESKDEMVSHPKHYIRGGMETIDVIEAFTGDLEGIEAYDTGAIIKYICRWKEKNGVQDLEKAMWYLQHLIDHVRGPMTIKRFANTPEEASAAKAYIKGVVDGFDKLNDTTVVRDDDDTISYCDGNWYTKGAKNEQLK